MFEQYPLFLSTVLFALAIVHTFSVKKITQWSLRFPRASVSSNLLHWLGEVEIVFGVWSLIFISIMLFWQGKAPLLVYFEKLNYIEPFFVFAIMCVCATKPIVLLSKRFIYFIARLLPLHKNIAFYVSILIVGPILGSFITEPAAMTVTALLLKDSFFTPEASAKFKYATLALLLVNISIGGVFTNFAAPPVVMVAHTWGWDNTFMFLHFGWKSFLSIVVSTALTAFLFSKELRHLSLEKKEEIAIPFYISAVHCFFVFSIVFFQHSIHLFLPLFLVFIGWCDSTKIYQSELKIKQGLLVGCFLGGLVTLGGMQDWWLKPLLEEFSYAPALFFSAVGLTAVTDNAALTFLSSLVPSLSESCKMAIMAGSVVGGGLTVIANAPNPIAFGLLYQNFGKSGISGLRLFLFALPYTCIAGFCLYVMGMLTS